MNHHRQPNDYPRGTEGVTIGTTNLTTVEGRQEAVEAAEVVTDATDVTGAAIGTTETTTAAAAAAEGGGLHHVGRGNVRCWGTRPLRMNGLIWIETTNTLRKGVQGVNVTPATGFSL